MRIAYLVNQYPATSHSFIRREIAELERQGVTVDRYSIRDMGASLLDPADKADFEKTRVLLQGGLLRLGIGCGWGLLTRPLCFLRAAIEALRLGYRSDRGMPRHLAYLAEACVLTRSMLGAGSQHLHAHFGTNAATVALLCQWLSGVSYSFTAHGVETFDRPEAISIGRKTAAAAFVVAVSDFGRAQLYRWCAPSHWSKIHVIRCGVDDSFLHRRPRPIPTTPRLVCIGRLSAEKGQLVLVEAAGRLAAEGVAFELVLGGDGEMRPAIEAAIDRLGLGARVRLLGWCDGSRVQEEILDSRLLVLPSFAEGLPVVLMEALALGRPVISTYVGGIPELVEPGVCGWLVPPGSVDLLARAIRTALGTPAEQLEVMGRAGAARVATMHDAATEAGRLARRFQETVGSRGQASDRTF